MQMESRIKGWIHRQADTQSFFAPTLHGQLRAYAHASIYIHASDVHVRTHPHPSLNIEVISLKIDVRNKKPEVRG